MAVRELFQFRRIGRVAGLDFPCFRQRKLLEQNALELQIGVYVELLSGEFSLLNQRS